MALILIVDDEPGVRRFLRKCLVGAGHNVLEAADGIEAVDRLHLSPVDLVLLDLVMPHREGLETLGIIREQYANIKVIAMSGRFPEFLRPAELLGAVGSLAKPIRPEELLALVRQALAE